MWSAMCHIWATCGGMSSNMWATARPRRGALGLRGRAGARAGSAPGPRWPVNRMRTTRGSLRGLVY